MLTGRHRGECPAFSSCTVLPPSRTSTWPVTYDAAGAATSSGGPGRPTGVARPIASSRSVDEPVAIQPGANNARYQRPVAALRGRERAGPYGRPVRHPGVSPHHADADARMYELTIGHSPGAPFAYSCDDGDRPPARANQPGGDRPDEPVPGLFGRADHHQIGA